MGNGMVSVGSGRRGLVTWLMSILSFFALQAGGQQPTLASPAATGAATSAAMPPDTGSTSQYIIGPGDSIQVFVWRNPDLSVTIPVRPDGKISTPLVEDLVAVGKTPSQLARDIEARLAEYVRNPQVNVILANAVGSFTQVKVVGQVKTPSSVPYREGMTVLDLIIAVGGLTDFAAGNRSKILRKDDKGKEIQINVRLESLVKRGTLSENLPIKPGDVVVVPEALL